MWGKGGGGGRRGGQEWSGIPILVPAVLRLEYSRLPRLLLIGWLPAWLFPLGLALGMTGIPSLVWQAGWRVVGSQGVSTCVCSSPAGLMGPPARLTLVLPRSASRSRPGRLAPRAPAPFPWAAGPPLGRGFIMRLADPRGPSSQEIGGDSRPRLFASASALNLPAPRCPAPRRSFLLGAGGWDRNRRTRPGGA